MHHHPRICPCPGCLEIRIWLASQAGDVTERPLSLDLLDVEVAERALDERPVVLVRSAA